MSSAIVSGYSAITSHLSHTPNLSSALANANVSSAKTIASHLAGLGVGLTPAGDDFILGAVLASWLIHPQEVAGVLAQEITDIAAPLTTSLSAAWLRSAGRGEAGILWHAFFEALNSAGRTESPVGIGSPAYIKRIREAMDNILSIGETSGADALAGFISTILYSMELKLNYVIPEHFC